MSSPVPAPEAPGVLESLARYWRMTAAIALLCAGLGVATALLLEQPVAEARIGLADPTGSTLVTSTSGDVSARFTQQRAAFADSDDVLRVLQEERPGTTLRGLREDVSTSADADAGVITVSAQAASADEAATLANDVVTAYAALTEEQVAEAREEALTAIAEQRAEVAAAVEGAAPDSPAAQAAAVTLAALDERVAEVSVGTATYGDGIAFVDEATPGTVVASVVAAVRNGVGGLLVGLLLAAVVAYVRAERAVDLRSSEEPAGYLGAPLLGEVAEVASGSMASLRRLPAEEFQFATSGLRTAVPTGVVLFSGSSRREGRTSTATNLATAAARDGVRVALVDADLRTRGLTKLLAEHLAVAAGGLSDVAAGEVPLDAALVQVPFSSRSSLWLLGAGSDVGDIPGLLRSDGLATAMDGLRDRFDLVVVDAPPALVHPDATALAPRADAVVVIVRAGEDKRALSALRRRLQVVDGRIAGYVYNGAEALLPEPGSRSSATSGAGAR